ncbi:hypothetical protein PIB30_085397, partial [Stylosanthes scabra]|nr:hypothetical protein [Stylosanthes scabra]
FSSRSEIILTFKAPAATKGNIIRHKEHEAEEREQWKKGKRKEEEEPGGVVRARQGRKNGERRKEEERRGKKRTKLKRGRKRDGPSLPRQGWRRWPSTRRR